MPELPSSSSSSDEQALREILEITRQLAAPSDLATLLGKVLTAARQLLKADRGSLFLHDQARGELYTTIADGTKEIRISLNQGLAGECGRTRQIINVPDCYQDPRFNAQVDKQTGYRTNTLIAVPLIGLDDQLVGVMQLLNSSRGRFDARDERIAEALASQGAVALQRAMLMEERLIKIKLERDLALAREIQQDVLPRDLPMIPGYDVATFSQPADETGGDIYDLIALPFVAEENAATSFDHRAHAPIPSIASVHQPLPTQVSDAHTLVLFLADATGHGIGPALSVTQARSMFRLGQRLGTDLAVLVRHINDQLAQDLSSNRFITAFMGRLDPTRHVVTYQSAGQGPIIHLSAKTGKCEFRAASTMPLGIMADLQLEANDTMHLAPGDMLVLLTDGFFEAMNPKQQLIGHIRIGEYLTAHRHLSANDIMQGLVAHIETFTQTNRHMDDLTGIVVKRVK